VTARRNHDISPKHNNRRSGHADIGEQSLEDEIGCEDPITVTRVLPSPAIGFGSSSQKAGRLRAASVRAGVRMI